MKINIKEIFDKHLEEDLKDRDYDDKTLEAVRKARSYESNEYLQKAIKEIVEAVVDKCAKEARTKCLNVEMDYVATTECSECEYHISDKQSILAVKEMIDYEKQG